MGIRRATIAAAVAAVVAAGAAAFGVTSAEAAGSVTATFSVDSDWGTAYQGKYTITNGTSAAISAWTVGFDLPSGTTVSSFWETTITAGGQHFTAVNVGWNGAVAAGASVTFGFVSSGSGKPTSCTINGASCSTGSSASPSASTTSPSASASPSPSASASASPSASASTSPSASASASPTSTGTSGKKVIGYFTNWGVYARNYHVKNLVTSGSAAKLTHIVYAFGNVTNGQCVLSDTYADYDKYYDAASSVDGTSDTWDTGALRGNFNQLRKLKKLYPNIKVLFSFGGWTYSGGFTQAAANATSFANSCYNVVEDSRWADVFDGIDIDWEYPNACGLSCDTSGFSAYKTLMSALRTKFGSSYLITSAITADGTTGGKIDAADYAGAAQYVDWYDVMTYDYFGAWATTGPTAPHAPLTSYSGIPIAGFYSDAAIQKLKTIGVPSSKLLLGIGFYGRGWTGVTQAAPGGTATGAAPGTYEAGIEDYKVLKTSCPATGTIAGTAYAYCGSNWWSYDTPSTISGKMSYAKTQGLGGAFFWEFSGDTTSGELVTAISSGLG
ncbi:glycosyl hydrolase family 18 protein [Hamadaea sp. NPDC051192]|uniref:glycosyl hydrolase family 18 protein n=1 Tax=Hamadaea sp. NPDC051192 TaxID=3154940 RepID=UPI003424291D